MLPRTLKASLKWFLGTVLICVVQFHPGIAAHGASLPVFQILFGQITNEIAVIRASFDNSAGQKRQLATLENARDTILDPQLRDDEALASLVKLLGDKDDYDLSLDESARNARASVMGTYDSMGLRVANLPPSRRTNTARNRYEGLEPEATALGNAANAANISALLAPFGRELESVARLVDRAQVMPTPRVRLNGVKAEVNGRRFTSVGDGSHSPNAFEVSAPDPLYRAVFCRVVDAERVITFTLPVVTGQVRYEIAQGLATLAFSDDVFSTEEPTINATDGTFFVQLDRKEIYGEFTAAGPGLEITSGRFRIKLPKGLRGD